MFHQNIFIVKSDGTPVIDSSEKYHRNNVDESFAKFEINCSLNMFIVHQLFIDLFAYFSLTDTSAPVVPSHRPPPAFATIDTTPVRSGDSLQRRTSGLRASGRREEEDRSELDILDIIYSMMIFCSE